MTDYIKDYTEPRFPFQRREAEDLRHGLLTKTFAEDGILRWTSNGRVPPSAVIEFARYLMITDGAPAFNPRATRAAEERETEAFLVEYRARQPAEPSPEHRAEARAAHGPGVELVDVITGRRFTT